MSLISTFHTEDLTKASLKELGFGNTLTTLVANKTLQVKCFAIVDSMLWYDWITTLVAFFSTLKIAIYANRFSHFLFDFNFPIGKVTAALWASEAFWMISAEIKLDNFANNGLIADGTFFANFAYKAFTAYEVVIKFVKLSINQPSLTRCTLKAFCMPGSIFMS